MHTPELTPLQRVANGDEAAVPLVVDTYGGLVWSLAKRFCPTEADAEDAVQDIFVLLWRKAGRFDPSRGAEATFVSVLARRLLIDRWRRAAARGVGHEVMLGAASSGSGAACCGELMEGSEVMRACTDALGELDEPHRSVLRLAFGGGLSHVEIARATGSPLGTVKSRLRNGLRRLREHLESTADARVGPSGRAGGVP